VRAFSLFISLTLFQLHATCAFAEESPPAQLPDNRQPAPDPMAGEPSDAKQPKRSFANDLLIVPRLLLTPPRLLWKGISYPLVWAANGEEKNHYSQKLYLVVTSWDGTIGVRPEVSYQLSFSPFFGLTFFHNKLLGPGTGFDTTFMFGLGEDLWFARVRMRPFAARHASQLYLLTQFNRRNDQLFTGVGMNNSRGLSRYSIDAFDVDAHVRSVVSSEARLFAGAMFGLRRYGDGGVNAGDLPISEVYCVRAKNGLCTNKVDVLQVPGFYTGTEFLRFNAGFLVDTRDSSFRPTSGALAEASVDYSHGLSEPSSYFRLRGSVMGVIDLWKRSHTLILRAWAMSVYPTNDAPVPFTELVVLGGPDDLRGVRWGLYRDFSGMLFTAEYRWPVWMWMDASLFTDAGGVFGQNFSDFNVTQLKPDIGAGIRIRTSQSFLFRLQLAWSPADGVQFFVSATAVP
jgi:hypothetical protein